MTLAEILLLLDRAGRHRALALLEDTRSRYLASAAKWGKEAAKSFGDFGDELRAQLGAAPAAPAKPSRAQVAAALGSLGIPQQKPAA